MSNCTLPEPPPKKSTMLDSNHCTKEWIVNEENVCASKENPEYRQEKFVDRLSLRASSAGAGSSTNPTIVCSVGGEQDEHWTREWKNENDENGTDLCALPFSANRLKGKHTFENGLTAHLSCSRRNSPDESMPSSKRTTPAKEKFCARADYLLKEDAEGRDLKMWFPEENAVLDPHSFRLTKRRYIGQGLKILKRMIERGESEDQILLQPFLRSGASEVDLDEFYERIFYWSATFEDFTTVLAWAAKKVKTPPRWLFPKEKYTLLMHACINGWVDMVTFILKQPWARLNEVDKVGHTALMLASARGHAQIVTMLLQKPHIDVNCGSRSGSDTALMLAIQQGAQVYPNPHENIAEMLINHPGIEVNRTNQKDFSALMLAAQYRRVNIVKHLLANRETDAMYQNEDGMTALMVAASCENNVNALRQLVEFVPAHRKAKYFNSRNKRGYTALMIAVIYKRVENVRYLLDVEQVNVNETMSAPLDLVEHMNHKHEEATALIIAAGLGYEEMVRLLLNHNGIDTEAKIKMNGKPVYPSTALGIARHKDAIPYTRTAYTAIREMLLAHRKSRTQGTAPPSSGAGAGSESFTPVNEEELNAAEILESLGKTRL